MSETEALPKVIVVGSTGYIGKATLQSLVARHGSKVQIFAGTRNPDKFDAKAVSEGIAGVVKTDLNDKESLTQALEGFDAAYLVIPGVQNREEVGMNGLDAAKAAGVKFVLLLSVLTVGEKDSIFGKQFIPLEAKVKDLGVPHAIVRLPLFIDNLFAAMGSIKGEGVMYDPRDPTKPHTPATITDIAKASADILANPDKHDGKAYDIVSPPYSVNDLAAAMTKALGKEIKVVTVPYEAAKKGYMDSGLQEWQVDGIMELFHLIDAESAATCTTNLGDVEAVTGEKAITMEQWVEQNAVAFK
eukprot:CAMPEP_0198116114 /NCGR_PEP_ID=MMETSP1442-20131203/9460_1 /TAXON_ID= /ORGANISM="Craspedostauros australis, Strain CCMP3328" /LENGTH=300 /DNA_ID=CAMNT_0043773813 /DNA_START=44 /DNA_END=946 /DNA_ORIENTATION=+